MEKSYLRLQEEHAKALSVSRERIAKWERFKGDYEALQARLHTLPNQLTYDVMVPFGKFAFMPGQLYHTNEVMVLLGENWFAQRSAKQALEMAERRKQYVMKELEEERKQLQDWQARVAFTEDIRASQQEHEDVKEIKEELHPEEQKTSYSNGKRVWKARKPAASGVPPPRPAFPKTTPPPAPPPSSASSLEGGATSDHTHTMTDEQLWERLDQLEREEEEEELRKGQGIREALRKEEAWQSSVCVGGSGTLQITVKHSASAQEPVGTMEPDVEEAVDAERPLFCTPGDISRHRPPPEEQVSSEEEGRTCSSSDEEGERRGVRWDPQLVRCKESPDRTERLEDENRARSDGTGISVKEMERKPLAFSGQVVERVTPMETKSATDSENPRKISKFKASRKTGT